MHFRTLLHSLDTEMIRSRDDSGKLPIHIACQTNAPVEVLAMLIEMDPATLPITDRTGALPIHLLLCSSDSGRSTPCKYARVRYLVEQGGVGTLAAHNRKGALPLHTFCGSTHRPWRVVQYLIQSFPSSVSMQTNAGEYPFIMEAASTTSSVSVVYEVVRANPGLLVSR